MNDGSRQLTRVVPVLALLGLLGLPGRTLAGDTVFRYSFSSSSPFPTVEDAGPAGNHATAGVLALLSSDIPPAGLPVQAGNRSLESSHPGAAMGDESGIVTDNTSLLANDRIAAAGGFTIEAWFKWFGGGEINAIIDYAGTEKIVIDQSGGPSDRVECRLSGFGDLSIGDAVVGEWHYFAVIFDTGGAPLNGNGSITGDLTVYFDDELPKSLNPNITKTNFGDSLDRGIGVGMHPLGFDADFFDGLTFEPRVTLGPLAADELLIATLDFPFRRGDADGDGAVNGLVDAIFVLGFQFVPGSPAPPCLKAADVDDDGSVSGLVDGVFLLGYQFSPGSPAPPEPGIRICGNDPSPDMLTCAIACP